MNASIINLTFKKDNIIGKKGSPFTQFELDLEDVLRYHGIVLLGGFHATIFLLNNNLNNVLNTVKDTVFNPYLTQNLIHTPSLTTRDLPKKTPLIS